ncbi:hypothetical protein C3F09_06960 [candidate division GN15 bacterium]|uniref:Uncharacterized protein n=1 Tax=candidate division GN15 bacterium TaxID=2072418 RepID=A0A855X3F3_9BACT|nr:MAG: hypothetical protein C3F09_06960 [candidate division GN15 bacterium]
MRYLSAIALALVAVTLMSCQKKQESPKVDMAVSTEIKLDGTPTTVAGVTFTPPSTWKDLGPSGMRKADYTFGPIEGESDSATLSVFYFGQGMGGDVESNIERWIGQMSLPDGTDPHRAAGQSQFKVDDMAVHWMQLSGTYASGGMMGSPAVPKPNYVMAAAVLEAPEGNLFFKLTGPQKSAAAMIEGFKAMIMAAKKSGM